MCVVGSSKEEISESSEEESSDELIESDIGVILDRM